MANAVELNGKTYHYRASLAMDLEGGKWKIVILFYLNDKEKRYSELCKQIPEIPEMTLSLQLKQLESDGLVFRNVQEDKPPIKVTYKLTKFGKILTPII